MGYGVVNNGLGDCGADYVPNGFALADLKGDVFGAVFDACMAIIGFAMRLAPYAVACLVFGVTARLGVDILKTLGAAWATITLISTPSPMIRASCRTCFRAAYAAAMVSQLLNMKSGFTIIRLPPVNTPSAVLK